MLICVFNFSALEFAGVSGGASEEQGIDSRVSWADARHRSIRIH